MTASLFANTVRQPAQRLRVLAAFSPATNGHRKKIPTTKYAAISSDDDARCGNR